MATGSNLTSPPPPPSPFSLLFPFPSHPTPPRPLSAPLTCSYYPKTPPRSRARPHPRHPHSSSPLHITQPSLYQPLSSSSLLSPGTVNMEPPDTTLTMRKTPPEPVFSPTSPDLITPPQPLRRVVQGPQSTPAVHPSPRPFLNLSPIRRLSRRHDYSPKTPTAFSRPPLVAPRSPDAPGKDGSAGSNSGHQQRPEDHPHTSSTRVPPIWAWDPQLETASRTTHLRDESLLQYFGEPFVPSVGSALMSEEEEREVFGKPLPHVDVEEMEEHEVTPFVLSYPTPDEALHPSPRPDSSPTLGAEDAREFLNAGLAESVRAFEASLQNRRLSISTEPGEVRIEEAVDVDRYGANFTTPRPRLPLRVTNAPPLQEAEPLSPSDFLRQARAIAQYRLGRRLGTPLPSQHRRSFSLPEMPRVALADNDSPPHCHTRPILTGTTSKSNAKQFGWSDELQAIPPDILARNQGQRRRSKSEAPISDIIIKGWVDRNWDDLQAAFNESDRQKSENAKRWLEEQEDMPLGERSTMGLSLGQRRIARVPVPALRGMDMDEIHPEAVPMTRSNSPLGGAPASATARHPKTLSDCDLDTGARHTGATSQSPPISALLGRSEVSLWLSQHRHLRQTETVKDKVRCRSKRRHGDEVRNKEPGVPRWKDKYRRRSGTPSGPRAMSWTTATQAPRPEPEVDLRTLNFKFPSAVPAEPSSSSAGPASPPPGLAPSPHISEDLPSPLDVLTLDKGKGKAKTLDEEQDLGDIDAEEEDDSVMEIDEEGDGFDPGEMRLTIELSAAESPLRTAFDLPRTGGETSSSPARAHGTEIALEISCRPIEWQGIEAFGPPTSEPAQVQAETADLVAVPELPTLRQESTLPSLPSEIGHPTSTTNNLFEESSLPSSNGTPSTHDDPPPAYFLGRGSDDPVASLPPILQATEDAEPDRPVGVSTQDGMWLAMPEPDWPDNLRVRYGPNEITSATPVVIEPYPDPSIPSLTFTPPTPKDVVPFARQQDEPATSQLSAKALGLLGIPPKNSTRDDRRRNTWHAEPRLQRRRSCDPLLPSAIAFDNSERMMSRMERRWEETRRELEATVDRINKKLGLEPLILPFYSPRDDVGKREAKRRREMLVQIEEEEEGTDSSAGPSTVEDRGRRRGIHGHRPTNKDEDRPRLGRSLSHHLLGVRCIDDVHESRDQLQASRPAPRPPTPEDPRLRRVTAKTGDTPGLSPDGVTAFETPCSGPDVTIVTPHTLSSPPHLQLHNLIPQVSIEQPEPSSKVSSAEAREAETDPRSPVALKRVRFAEGTKEDVLAPRQAGITDMMVDALADVLGQLWRSFTGAPRR